MRLQGSAGNAAVSELVDAGRAGPAVRAPRSPPPPTPRLMPAIVARAPDEATIVDGPA